MIAITPETITVCCLCVIAIFMVGFVAGISLEYHTSNQAMAKRLNCENTRLREIAAMTGITHVEEALPAKDLP